MFTGIVTDVGKVRSIRQTNRDRRFEIETRFDLATIVYFHFPFCSFIRVPHLFKIFQSTFV